MNAFDWPATILSDVMLKHPESTLREDRWLILEHQSALEGAGLGALHVNEGMLSVINVTGFSV